MTNQDIVDRVEDAIIGDVDGEILEQILEAVWIVLADNRADGEEGINA